MMFYIIYLFNLNVTSMECFLLFDIAVMRFLPRVLHVCILQLEWNALLSMYNLCRCSLKQVFIY